MRQTKLAVALLIVTSVILSASMAFAGGPLIVDPTTRTAYTYGPGTVPVYYDLGNLGEVMDYTQHPPVQVIFDNSVGAQLVQNGFNSWSSVATSSFRANVVGDFSLIGLPNINSTNVSLIIGGPERYGVYVIFDEDGSIMQNFLGAPEGVLGISEPQYANGTTITMSWTVLNGSKIDPHDTNGQNFQGVATHEFGHALGMAHTQSNGAAYFYNDNVGPGSCSNLPYPTNLTKADVETMYPYINNRVGGTGIAQGSVHTLDTTGAFSDLYPGPGWPNSYGTITGKVYSLDGKTELTGVNVIARNLADPYVGSTSALSGQMTQGQLGPDGSFTLHGLQPGAQYVFYLDAIIAGGFPTPPLWFLPGPERFWSTSSQDSCTSTAITAVAGQTVSAPISFIHTQGTPMLYVLGYGPTVSSMTSDGSIAVGNYGPGGPIFQWTANKGVQLMPNVYSAGSKTAISPNGQFIADTLADAHGNSLGAWRWDQSNGWLQTTPVGSCGTTTNFSEAVANDGSVLGGADHTCRDYHAFRWNPSTGTILLPSATKKRDGSDANSRVDMVSADGTTAVGFETPFGARNAGLWTGISSSGATPHTVTDIYGNSVYEAYAISGDGSMMAGALYEGQYPYDGSGWRRTTAGGNLEYFPGFPGVSITKPFALNQDGSVMVGFSGDPNFDLTYGPFIWTKQLGTANLDDFVKLMGGDLLGLPTLNSPNSMSADGTTIGGYSGGYLGYTGWVLQIKKAYVCHAVGAGQYQTLSVGFPGGFDQHLANGDTAGPCQQ
jgi:uncharacterized membrane protein